MTKKERFEEILGYFDKNIPEATTELSHENPYELLVATILSAQCTDKRVNMVTLDFFKKFSTPEKLSKATFDDVFSLIKSISYPNNKTKHLIGMAKKVMEEFDGKIPSTVDDLQKLPGVGRKTANVVASVIFNVPAMAVDTHVFRVSARIGLTVNAKNPLQTEMQLIKYIPENKISIAHHWLILHGRYICTARNPQCEKCGIRNFCRYYELLKKN